MHPIRIGTDLTSSRAEGAGFLRRSSGSTELLLSRFGGFQLLAICIAHFTGATGVSRPENVDRADPIDVHRGIFADVCSDAQAALVKMDGEDDHVPCSWSIAPKWPSPRW